MVELPRRTRADACITDLAFDHWLANDLAPDARVELEQHLAGCTRCQTRKAELEAKAAAFLASAPSFKPRAAAPVVALRPRRKVAPFVAAGLAAAAAVLLMFRSTDEALDTTRSKGSDHFGFYIKRGEHVSEGQSGARVRPGDQLRFTYTIKQARHIAVLSLDGAGVASVYFPDAASTRELPAGRARALPDAVELDDTLGEETLFGLFCTAPLELEPIRQQLAQQRGAFEPPAACQVQRITIVKEPKP
jgi:hypothetical protein